ncbi:sugar phosphate nucleotidyltransferase [Desulfonatronospira thiodismutans]|uniref:sugar phosphate nucleotidyltransferase n=1 Tax=Desulfonatronospira thiodismutans TaxID=488939 RepID=UPI001FCA1A91|nr:sugar phosphate nucleotidyltransferase [Desulfonatronospira thiodismutans]
MDTMIIPAAGFGTRMQEFTRGKSKELLDVGGKPAIQYALEEAAAAGIRVVGIVLRKGKEEIGDYIIHSKKLSWLRESLDLHFFHQQTMNGECGAILAAGEIVEHRPFIVHYPDNIILNSQGLVTNSLRKGYIELGSDLVSLVAAGKCENHPSSQPMSMEHAFDEVYLLEPRMETRHFSAGLRTAGVYVASPTFLDACSVLLQKKEDKEVRDRDVHCLLAEQGHQIYGLKVKTKILDVGSPKGYLEARKLLDDN